ncbi:MAG: CoA ester lyase [Acidimicrobiia bacterium]|nr:CoA ester lyase [Acidimicrobiia bacterium]MDH3397338.1 CoA ester lyase [Acidimicrobiia bacterium]
MTARSYLFVPGDRPDMLTKAGRRSADAVIADLEDAVAPAGKAAARDTVSDWLDNLAEPGFEPWVRVNPTEDLLEDDLAAVFRAPLHGIMVPKVRSVDELLAIGDLLERLESAAGRPPSDVKLLPIVETADGLLAVDELARAPRVHQLMIGEFDLGAELGVDPTYEAAFVPLRMQLVVASAAAGIEPPLGPVSPDFQDLDLLRDETRRLVRLGFGSRPAIHPAQVPVFNEVMTPTPEETERAGRLVSLYEQALADGRGAITDDAGHMVDEATIKVARRVLETARRAVRRR